METKRRSGRPKKAESDKVQYQRIAVYLSDYDLLVEKVQKRKELDPRFKLTDAFTEMVKNFQ